jgi:hypothetical protein
VPFPAAELALAGAGESVKNAKAESIDSAFFLRDYFFLAGFGA